MDKIRRAFSNADGSPRTGLTVVAIPALGGPQVAMPETSVGKSGIYASSAEVAHGTYKIQVNGVDTGDTQTVEPGLHLSDYPNLAATASIDRSLSDSVRLSNFFVGDQSEATHANMAAACALAALRGKKLILDADVTTTSGISVTGNLTIDLNGHTLTLGGPITASVRMAASFGRVVTASGKYLRGVSSQLFLGVDFTGGGDEQIAEATSTHAVYIACPGISRTKFSGSSPNWTGPIVIGCDAAGTADRLMLGSRANKDVGDDRLRELQAFIDSYISQVVTVSNTVHPTIAEYTRFFNDMNPAVREYLCNGIFYGSVLANFSTDEDQDCDYISVVNGQFAKNDAVIELVNEITTFIPTKQKSVVQASGNEITLGKPSNVDKYHEVTVIHGSMAVDVLAVTANFASTTSMNTLSFRTSFSGNTYSTSITFVWSTISKTWISSRFLDLQ